MTLYENIKALRESLKMSQDELATKVGYKDRTSIAKIESGKVDLSQSKNICICQGFKCITRRINGFEVL